MEFLERFQAIIDALKGANPGSENETAEIVGVIDQFGLDFSELVRTVVAFVKEVYEALQGYFA